MSKSKRIARNEVVNVVVEPTNVEVPIEIVNVTEESVEIAEIVETLAEKVIRIKNEQAEKLAYYNELKKSLDEQVKQLKAEEIAMKAAAKEAEAKMRFEKLAAKLKRPEDSKKNAIINAIMDGAESMEMVAEWTGFDQKLVSDVVWGLEKAMALR